jgi:hypothetical protein
MTIPDWLTPMLGPEPDLAGLDPITAPATPQLIDAAVTYARNINVDPETALSWGRYAYQSATQLWGDSHPETISVGREYQRVLLRQGLTFEALRIAEHRHGVAVKDGDPVRELASRCSLALALHRDGQCTEAVDHTGIALRQWWASPHGYGHADTVLVSAAAIWAGCGHPSAAIALLRRDATHLAALGETCRQYAATCLADVAATHPQWCTDTSPAPTGSAHHHRGFWLDVLQTATPARGHHTPARRSPR